MYKKMLVPLDGSTLAECVLPHVKAIAGGCSIGDVILVQVVEPLKTGDFPAVAAEWETAQTAKAEEYLAKIQAQLSVEALNVGREVLIGKPADTISEYVQNEGIGLIAIATHGRSGISRWVLGSVAEKIVRSSSAPVLVIRAHASGNQ